MHPVSLNQKVASFVLVFGHILAWFLNQTVWPISSYPMYASKFEPITLSLPSYVGVVNSHKTVVLRVSKYFFPYTRFTLTHSLGVHEKSEVQGLLRKLLVLYEARRKEYGADWPQLQKIIYLKSVYKWTDLVEAKKKGIQLVDVQPLKVQIIEEASL